MMKATILLLSTLLSFPIAATTKISTLDFVQVLNGHHDEATYFYQNNWKALRQAAVENQFIDSFALIETKPTKEAPYDFILITTYQNQDQFDRREANFDVLMKERGSAKFLNDKRPSQFRKTIHQKTSKKTHTGFVP